LEKEKGALKEKKKKFQQGGKQKMESLSNGTVKGKEYPKKRG